MPPVPDPYPSEKQIEVIQYIVGYIEANGFQPSQAEIAVHFGVSKNAIQGRLREAARRGLIELTSGMKERAIRLKNFRFTAHVVEEDADGDGGG